MISLYAYDKMFKLYCIAYNRSTTHGGINPNVVLQSKIFIDYSYYILLSLASVSRCLV